MSGSGTALVEAALLGRLARGADIDPLARLIAKAKATPVDLAVFDKATIVVGRLLTTPQLDDSWRPVLPDCGPLVPPGRGGRPGTDPAAILLAGGHGRRRPAVALFLLAHRGPHLRREHA